MSKLPAIQFYPGDWRKDVGVQSLNYHDRGVWFEMLLLMHDSEVRGKLMLGGKAMTDEILASVLRVRTEVLTVTIKTLIERGVTERDKRTGALVNRRMIRDEELRAENRGKVAGWRKAKKLKNNCNQDVPPPVTGLLPLSSSSSSSSVTHTKQRQKQVQPQAAFELPAWVDTDAWKGFEEMRKRERHPLTDRARTTILNKLSDFKARGHDPTAILDAATERGWRSVFIPDEMVRSNGNGHHPGGTNGAQSSRERQRRAIEEQLDAEAADDAGGAEGSAFPVH